MSEIKNNEKVYDEQIFPLMNEIIRICKEHNIPVLASFEYAPDNFCTTAILPEDSSENLRKAAKIIRNGPGLIAFTITTVPGK